MRAIQLRMQLGLLRPLCRVAVVSSGRWRCAVAVILSTRPGKACR
ncbi:Unknown protein sequence [Pseudomonas syringae pv. aceris]|nr:Unknown protein sequence [Pseudomonas syringae pv. aceris]